jgi:peptidase A4-like protein
MGRDRYNCPDCVNGILKRRALRVSRGNFSVGPHTLFASGASYVSTAFGWAAAAGAARAGERGTPSLRTHGPIQVHRLDDGSLARGPRNEFSTSNWSGYAIGSFQTGQKYTSASATWSVPAVAFGATQSGTDQEYSATWVGIGGFCMNALCSRVDRSLIQLGTSQYVSSANATSYFAWYEMLPAAPVTITAITVHPGDKISASLQCVSACSAKKQNWQLTMTNNTTGQSWTQTFAYSSSLSSADWIEEAPVSSSVLPLADFGVVGFVPYIGPNAAWNTLTVSANGIQMTDPWGQTSNPSSTDANGFNACWGFGSQAPCASP